MLVCSVNFPLKHLSPFLLEAFPSSDFGSPLDLPVARLSFSQCFRDLQIISSSLTSVLVMCTSLPQTINILHFTPLRQEAEMDQV